MNTPLNIAAGIYRKAILVGTWAQHPLLLILRLWFGWGFFKAGLGKLNNIEQTIEIFRQWDVPMPEVNVYMAGCTELVFGLMLLAGLASRLASIVLISVMMVAYLTAHWPEVFVQMHDGQRAEIFESGFDYGTMLSDFVAAPPFMFLVTCLVVFCFGPGVISADYAIGRWLLPKELRDKADPTDDAERSTQHYTATSHQSQEDKHDERIDEQT